MQRVSRLTPSHLPSLRRIRRMASIFCLCLGLLTGCAPSPQANVLGYLLAQQLGTLTPPDLTPSDLTTTGALTGALTGVVTDATGAPVAGAVVVVATRAGQPFAATTAADGSYTIPAVPIGQYVPAAVAPGYDEGVPRDALGMARLVTIAADTTPDTTTPDTITAAPPIALTPHQPYTLPALRDGAVELTVGATTPLTTPFPAGAVAQMTPYTLTYAATADWPLRVYLPATIAPGTQLPTFLMIYPTDLRDWESVSVGFAAAGYGFVALSPSAQHATDIDAHARDARLALELARQGLLHPALAADDYVVLGGSFSSPILHRLLRDDPAGVAAWVTVGGISNAFDIAAAFYAGEIQLPERFRLAVPALGAPNLYPELFLRYSPVYTAAQLPPTLIIHTDADEVTPLDQALQLEAALAAAGVPHDVFYYRDVTHYLEIGENLTDAGKEMYHRILSFAQRYQPLPPAP